MRLYILLFFLILISFSIAQNTTSNRVFNGSVSINLGKYEDYYLRVLTGESTLYVNPGDTVSFKLYVRRGEDDTELHNIEIIDNDEIFELSVEPKVIEILRNIDMVILRATLYVPPDTPQGTYPIRINVKGKEFVEENYPLDTKMVVGSNKNYLNIGLLLLSALFIGMMVYRIINITNIGEI